jgi:hypothetical protein
VAERPNPDFPFARLVAIASRRGASVDELARLATMDGLARDLKAMARRGLSSSIPA